MFNNPYPSQIHCRGKFLCCFFDTCSLMCDENPLEIFPFLHPPPHWKIKQIDPPPFPPGKSNPFRGDGMDIFWNHTFDQNIQTCFKLLLMSWNLFAIVRTDKEPFWQINKLL